MEELLKQILSEIQGMKSQIEGLNTRVDTIEAGQKRLEANQELLGIHFTRLEADLTTKMQAVNEGWNYSVGKMDRVTDQLDRMEAVIGQIRLNVSTKQS